MCDATVRLRSRFDDVANCVLNFRIRPHALTHQRPSELDAPYMNVRDYRIRSIFFQIFVLPTRGSALGLLLR